MQISPIRIHTNHVNAPGIPYIYDLIYIKRPKNTSKLSGKPTIFLKNFKQTEPDILQAIVAPRHGKHKAKKSRFALIDLEQRIYFIESRENS